jgi:hypothetical protein
MMIAEGGETMTAILIISGLGIMILGYILMDNIDRFMKKGGVVKEYQGESESTVLIYASDGILPALEPLLSREHISYRILRDPHSPRNLHTHTALAISDNDLDNLLFCSEIRHLHPNAYTIARCNNALYQHVYEGVGIHRILTGTTTPDRILSVMKGGE